MNSNKPSPQQAIQQFWAECTTNAVMVNDDGTCGQGNLKPLNTAFVVPIKQYAQSLERWKSYGATYRDIPLREGTWEESLAEVVNGDRNYLQAVQRAYGLQETFMLALAETNPEARILVVVDPNYDLPRVGVAGIQDYAEFANAVSLAPPAAGAMRRHTNQSVVVNVDAGDASYTQPLATIDAESFSGIAQRSSTLGLRELEDRVRMIRDVNNMNGDITIYGPTKRTPPAEELKSRFQTMVGNENVGTPEPQRQPAPSTPRLGG